MTSEPMIKDEDPNNYDSLCQYNIQKCELCDMVFSSRLANIIHSSQHVIIPLLKQRVHQCDRCLFCFTSKSDLEVHKDKHKDVPASNEEAIDNGERIIIESETPGIKLFETIQKETVKSKTKKKIVKDSQANPDDNEDVPLNELPTSNVTHNRLFMKFSHNDEITSHSPMKAESPVKCKKTSKYINDTNYSIEEELPLTQIKERSKKSIQDEQDETVVIVPREEQVLESIITKQLRVKLEDIKHLLPTLTNTITNKTNGVENDTTKVNSTKLCLEKDTFNAKSKTVSSEKTNKDNETKTIDTTTEYTRSIHEVHNTSQVYRNKIIVGGKKKDTESDSNNSEKDALHKICDKNKATQAKPNITEREINTNKRVLIDLKYESTHNLNLKNASPSNNSFKAYANIGEKHINTDKSNDLTFKEASPDVTSIKSDNSNRLQLTESKGHKRKFYKFVYGDEESVDSHTNDSVSTIQNASINSTQSNKSNLTVENINRHNSLNAQTASIPNTRKANIVIPQINSALFVASNLLNTYQSPEKKIKGEKSFNESPEKINIRSKIQFEDDDLMLLDQELSMLSYQFKSVHYDDLVEPELCECRRCHMICGSKLDLTIHETTHMRLKRSKRHFFCKHCEKYFYGNHLSQKKHYESVHNTVPDKRKPFSCPSCKLEYHKLNDHYIKYHNNLFCNDCTKCFANIKSKRRHKCINKTVETISTQKTTELLQVCGLCLSFKQKRSRKLKYDVVGEKCEVGEKQLCCFCNKAFFAVKLVRRVNLKSLSESKVYGKKGDIDRDSNKAKLFNIHKRLKALKNK